MSENKQNEFEARSDVVGMNLRCGPCLGNVESGDERTRFRRVLHIGGQGVGGLGVVEVGAPGGSAVPASGAARR